MSENNSNPFKNEDVVTEDDVVKTKEEETSAQETPEAEAADELTQLQKKYDELNNQYVRLAADFDNYRKRQAQERESLINYGTENALTKLIEVLDNFERAQKSLEGLKISQKSKKALMYYKNRLMKH